MNAWHERNEKEVFPRIGLGMREGVGEDSRHGIEYVDIQVGSCICSSVFYVGSLHVHLGGE